MCTLHSGPDPGYFLRFGDGTPLTKACFVARVREVFRSSLWMATVGTASRSELQRWLPRRELKIRQFRYWAGGAALHSGPTSISHVNAWQATQPSWREAGPSDLGLIYLYDISLYCPVCVNLGGCLSGVASYIVMSLIWPLFAMRHTYVRVRPSPDRMGGVVLLGG